MTEGVIPSLHVYSKNTPLKQYHKTCGRGAGLRTETTINNTYDFGVGRLLGNLPTRSTPPEFAHWPACSSLREKVIRPVLAGICKPRLGRPPKIIHPIDIHYQNLQREMHLTLRHLALAA